MWFLDQYVENLPVSADPVLADESLGCPVRDGPLPTGSPIPVVPSWRVCTSCALLSIV